MNQALTKAEKGGLRKVSKGINLLDRRIQHARQLFNERLARAESEYYEAMRQALTAEFDKPSAPVDQKPDAPSSSPTPVEATT